jgi:hypothetical protein
MAQGQGGFNFKSAITGSQVSGQPAIQPSVGLNLSAAPLVSLASDMMNVRQRAVEAMGNTLMRGGELVANTLMKQQELDAQKDIADQNMAMQRERQAAEQQNALFEQQVKAGTGELFKLQEDLKRDPMNADVRKKYQDFVNSDTGRLAQSNLKAEERKLYSTNLEDIDTGVADSLLANSSIQASLEYFGQKGMADIVPGMLSRALTSTGSITMVDPLDPSKTFESPLNQELVSTFRSLPSKQQAMFLEKIQERSKALLEQQDKKTDMSVKLSNAQAAMSNAQVNMLNSEQGQAKLKLDIEKYKGQQMKDLQAAKESNMRIQKIQADIEYRANNPKDAKPLSLKNPADRELAKMKVLQDFGKNRLPNPTDEWVGLMYNELGISSNSVEGLNPHQTAMTEQVNNIIMPMVDNIMDEAVTSGKSTGDVILSRIAKLTGEKDLTRAAQGGGSLEIDNQSGTISDINALRFLYKTYSKNPKQIEIFNQQQRIYIGGGTR